MTQVEFAKYIRQKTKQNSATFTDAEILALAVPTQEDIAKEIIKANEDFFGIEKSINLVADQREYDFIDDFDLEILQIKIVQAKLDGTDWEDPPLIEYDNNTLRINTDEDSIVDFFSNYNGQYNAGYFIFGEKLIILNDSAITAVVNGLKIWAIVYPTKIDSLAGTDDMSQRPASGVGFPKQFHELWARRIIIEWKESQDEPIKLSAREMNYENDFKKALAAIRGLNLDRAILATTPYDDGQDY